MNALDVVPVALLGGIAGLDTVSFPQAMISRPLVSATLGAALVGAPMQGLLLGAILELIALETLPVGASRYPEWGSASVVAGAIYGRTGAGVVGAVMVAVLGALLFAWFGGWSMVALRRRNAVVARRHRAALEAGSRGAVLDVQLSGLTSDFARAVLVSAAAYLVLVPAERLVLLHWTLGERLSRAELVATAASVALGSAWKLFHSTAGARWFFFGGLGIGLLVLGMR